MNSETLKNGRNYSSSVIFLLIGIGNFVINGTDFLLFSLVMILFGLTGVVTEFFFNSNEPKDERMRMVNYKSGFFSHNVTNISIVIFAFLSAFEYIESITLVLFSLLLVNSISFIISLSINSLKT
ncbi:hypothetical protein [Halobacillus campisalis]|uniref:Uncharacterized protein n=1 Tax=Halobacillus campisalis TaxID=435909 RepID=A0ABW2K1I1_9BACI|nr:hypothetical protein [Halobacillus campisalis]